MDATEIDSSAWDGRGAADAEESGPLRRCIASGDSLPKSALIRFVLDPDGRVVPDLTHRLPGRGVYLACDRRSAERAVAKGLFRRAWQGAVGVDADLADSLEWALRRRLIDLVGLARRAGEAVAGFEKVRERVGGRRGGVLLHARDGAADGKRKLSQLAPDWTEFDLLDAAELGQVFGRETTVHACVSPGGIAARIVAAGERLCRYRGELISDSSRATHGIAPTQVEGQI